MEKTKTEMKKLPELVGSPKQIAWAEDIRAKLLPKWRKELEELEAEDDVDATFLQDTRDAVKWLESETDAGSIIKARHCSLAVTYRIFVGKK